MVELSLLSLARLVSVASPVRSTVKVAVAAACLEGSRSAPHIVANNATNVLHICLIRVAGRAGSSITAALFSVVLMAEALLRFTCQFVLLTLKLQLLVVASCPSVASISTVWRLPASSFALMVKASLSFERS